MKLRNYETTKLRKRRPGGRLFCYSNPSAKMPVRVVVWSLLLAGLGSGGSAGAVMVAVLVQVMLARPASSAVVTVAPVTSSGPRFSAVTRYSKVWPRPANCWIESIAIARSASSSTPTPSSGTMSGLVGALVTRSTEALRAPLADGLKTTRKVHDNPGERVLPGRQSLFCRLKSAASAPPMPRLLISSGVVPLLVSVTGEGADDCPTTTSPKSSAIGEKPTTGMMPVPWSTKVSGLVDALLAIPTPSACVPVIPGENS